MPVGRGFWACFLCLLSFAQAKESRSAAAGGRNRLKIKQLRAAGAPSRSTQTSPQARPSTPTTNQGGANQGHPEIRQPKQFAGQFGAPAKTVLSSEHPKPPSIWERQSGRQPWTPGQSHQAIWDTHKFLQHLRWHPQENTRPHWQTPQIQPARNKSHPWPVHAPDKRPNRTSAAATRKKPGRKREENKARPLQPAI